MEFSAETEARIIAMYREGSSTNNIGRRLGFHKSYAVAVLVNHGIPLRYRRITIPEGIAMSEMYGRLIPGPVIATHFQTTPTAVYAALKRLGRRRGQPEIAGPRSSQFPVFNLGGCQSGHGD